MKKIKFASFLLIALCLTASGYGIYSISKNEPPNAAINESIYFETDGLMPDYTLGEIIDSSDIIIVGTTITDSSYWNTENKEKPDLSEKEILQSEYNIFTDYTIKIENSLKGKMQNKEITLTVSGGTVNNDTVYDKTAPVFKEGGSCLLFLTKNDDGSYYLNTLQGYLTSADGKNYSNFKYSFSLEDLKAMIELPEDELKKYIAAAKYEYVFAAEIKESEEGNEKLDSLGIPYQIYTAEIIDEMKGGDMPSSIQLIQFGGYYTKEQLYEREELSEDAYQPNLSEIQQNEFGYYEPSFWDPENSPLTVGEAYIITAEKNDAYEEYWTEYIIWGYDKQLKIENENDIKEYEQILKKSGTYELSRA
ncbi:MAG: hypothetical protein LBU81_03190 [Methanosarcinales archaeon]|jgi:hypothetical protein|nr:hypothetical protein [Methanosarcinales archaeon]